jgi:hypothetical protein
MSESLKNPKNSTATIPTDVHYALFGIINKSRMLNGWKTKTSGELDATIKAWAEVFERYSIPISAYQELYLMAFDTRQIKMRQGGDIPAMDATLIVSHWEGEYGLRSQIKQREYQEFVKKGRYLGGSVEEYHEQLPPEEGIAYFRSLLEKENHEKLG